jgi:hypothetical protein
MEIHPGGRFGMGMSGKFLEDIFEDPGFRIVAGKHIPRLRHLIQDALDLQERLARLHHALGH